MRTGVRLGSRAPWHDAELIEIHYAGFGDLDSPSTRLLLKAAGGLVWRQSGVRISCKFSDPRTGLIQGVQE